MLRALGIAGRGQNDQERMRETVSKLEERIWSDASSHEDYTKILQRRISLVQSQPPPQPTEAPPPAAAAQPALSAAAPPPSNRKSRATNSNSAGPSAPAAAASSTAPSGSGSAAFNAIAAAAPAPPPPKPQFGPPPPSAFFQIPPVERPFRDAAAQYWSLVAKYRKRIDKKAVEDFQKKLVARLNQKTEEERKNERPEVGNRATQLRKDIEEFMKRLYVEKEPKNLSHAAISGPKGVADILRLNELQYAVEKAVILATANNNAGRVSPAPSAAAGGGGGGSGPGSLVASRQASARPAPQGGVLPTTTTLKHRPANDVLPLLDMLHRELRGAPATSAKRQAFAMALSRLGGSEGCPRAYAPREEGSSDSNSETPDESAKRRREA